MKWRMVIDTPYHSVESIEFDTSEQVFKNRQDQLVALLSSSLRETVEVEGEVGSVFIPFDLLCESVVVFVRMED